MSINMSDYFEQQLFDHIFREETMAKPNNICIALCSGVMEDSQTGTTIPEIPNGGAYARVTNASGDPFWNAHGVSGPGDNTAQIAFAASQSVWGTISGVAICDSGAYGEGNVLMWGYLNSERIMASGDTFVFNAGNFDITFA